MSRVLAVVVLSAVAGLPSQALAQGGKTPLCQTGCVTYGVSVTPDGAFGGSLRAFTGGHAETFAVKNTGNTSDTYNISCSGGNITCTGTSLAQVTLAAGATAEVDAYFSTGAQGSASLTLTAAATNALHNATDHGSFTFTITAPVGAPIVDASPYNFDDQDYGRCAQACFAAVYAQSTVPYFSMDAPRNVTLSYNGDRVNPKPFVLVNATPDLSHPGSPTEYRLQVKVNGAFVTFLNGEQVLRFTYPGTAPARLGGQFDGSSYTQGVVYPMDILVSAKYGDSLLTNDVVTKLAAVNEVGSPIARGWTIAGIERLYQQADGSALLTGGDGSAVYFQNSGGVFTSPAGEFSKLVSGTPGGGSGWTLLSADSTKVVFDATGRMTQVLDRFGNATNIVYDASLRPWKIQDPTHTQQAPREIVLSYGANGLNSIADPFGRTTNITVDASHLLTAFQDPGGGTTRFGYDATLRLKSMTDRGGYADTLVYDALSGKLAAVKSPPDTGLFGEAGPVSLVAGLAPWQVIGIPYTPTAGTAFTTVLRDSVRALAIDPGSDTTRFAVDHWGQPVRTTDALGRVDTVTYNASGLPIRLTRPSGGVDSLDYNGDGLVVYVKPAGLPATYTRYTSWAVADSTWGSGAQAMRAFVSGGKVDSARLAGTYMSRFTYDTRGRVLTATDPAGHTVTTTYGPYNDNRASDSVAGGRLTTYVDDIYGRRIDVFQAGGRELQTTYDLLNRVLTSDARNAAVVHFEYDSLRLKAVVDAKGQRYQYGYDALGNLVRRTDPLGRSDLYAFDRHGLMRRLTNRRGQTVDYTYNRLHRPVKKAGAQTSTDSTFYGADDRTLIGISTSGTLTSRETAYLDIAGRPDSVATTINGFSFVRRFGYRSADGLLDSTWTTSPPGTSLLTRRYAWTPSRGTLDSLRLGTTWTRFGFNSELLPRVVRFPGDSITQDFTTIHEGMDVRAGAFLAATVNSAYATDTRSFALSCTGFGGQ